MTQSGQTVFVKDESWKKIFKQACSLCLDEWAANRSREAIRAPTAMTSSTQITEKDEGENTPPVTVKLQIWRHILSGASMPVHSNNGN